MCAANRVAETGTYHPHLLARVACPMLTPVWAFLWTFSVLHASDLLSVIVGICRRCRKTRRVLGSGTAQINARRLEKAD